MKIAVSLAAALALAAAHATVASAQGRPDTPAPPAFAQDKNATPGNQGTKPQDTQNRSRDMQNPMQTGRDVQNRETTAPMQKSTETMPRQDRHDRVAQHRMDRSRWSHAERRRHYRGPRVMMPPPRGWHRHERRPWDWRNRGCYRAGPFWMCR